MNGNFVLADLETSVGMVGSLSAVTVPINAGVSIAVTIAVQQIIAALLPKKS